MENANRNKRITLRYNKYPNIENFITECKKNSLDVNKELEKILSEKINKNN